MNFMIGDSKSSVTPATATESVPADVISYATSKCALGHVLVARSTNGVCAILLGDEVAELEAELAASFPKAALIGVQEDLAKVCRFLKRPAGGIHLTLDRRGTPFQRRVWDKLCAVSVGRTVTYMELARWISPLASPRAVARACAANTIALAVPCHRAVHTSGDLCGYRWGVERKRELIKKEAG